jgi:hypothetical protein
MGGGPGGPPCRMRGMTSLAPPSLLSRTLSGRWNMPPCQLSDMLYILPTSRPAFEFRTGKACRDLAARLSLCCQHDGLHLPFSFSSGRGKPHAGMRDPCAGDSSSGSGDGRTHFQPTANAQTAVQRSAREGRGSLSDSFSSKKEPPAMPTAGRRHAVRPTDGRLHAANRLGTT